MNKISIIIFCSLLSVASYGKNLKYSSYADAIIEVKCVEGLDATPALAEAMEAASYLHDHLSPMSDAAAFSTEGATIDIKPTKDSDICTMRTSRVIYFRSSNVLIRDFYFDSKTPNDDAALTIYPIK